jgi:simple sugar transport system ATP-binding protein
MLEATHPAPSRSGTAPGLELINLSKRFGDFVALDSVSMRVAPGAFHALLGENGAGKSTLVKCVIGYQAPSSGDLLLGNKQVSFQSTRGRTARGSAWSISALRWSKT